MDAAAAALLAGTCLGLRRATLPEPPVDDGAGLPLLAAGRVHEWFLASENDHGTVWHPPLTLLVALATRFAGEGQRIVWIGRACWPTFQLLYAMRDPSQEMSLSRLLAQSVFLDPLTDAERHWAIAPALRCAGVKVVVADGSGLSETASRRLQLAAEAGHTLGLLARPPHELACASWAATRWLVTPQKETEARAMAWEIELMCCRGRHPGPEVPRRWTMEWTYQVFHGTSALHLSPRVGCGTAAAPQVPGWYRSA